MAEKSVIVIGSGFAGLSAASFMAKEVQTLSKMAKLLGEKDDEKYYQELFNCIQKAVNELLWDEETKTFRDRFLDGVVNKNVI